MLPAGYNCMTNWSDVEKYDIITGVFQRYRTVGITWSLGKKYVGYDTTMSTGLIVPFKKLS